MKPKSIDAVFLSLLRSIHLIAERAKKNPCELFSCEDASPMAKYFRILCNVSKDSEAEILRQAERILRLSYTPQDRTNSPLGCIFNFMDMGNAEDKDPFFYEPQPLDKKINYPKKQTEQIPDERFYSQILGEILPHLKNLSADKNGIHRLMSVLEKYLFYLPDDTAEGDLSLYDMSKICAALANCITEYQSASAKEPCVDPLNAEMFLMFSADFSGIQKFIYTLSSKGALRTLRSRSFILEVLMEHIVDELLDMAHVSRANLIYSGGGHCYLLLPNTPETIQGIEKFSAQVKDWLIENFGSSLYLAFAYQKCSGSELMNHPSEKAPYKEIFRSLSRMLSKDKMMRYTPEEIIRLNSCFKADGQRECKICGRMDRLDSKEELCSWCKGFQEIASLLTSDRLQVFCSKDLPSEVKGFEVPGLGGRVYLCFAEDSSSSIGKHPSIVRRYSKNRSGTPSDETSINLYMGDYIDSKFLTDLADQAEGIRRIGILRADVDNLGTAFVSGFEQKSSENIQQRFRYVSLIRTAAFSAQMSLFFKYHINTILRGEDIDFFSMDPLREPYGRHALIVYSGGDDIFLAGAWNDTIESSIDIYRAFRSFTCSKLTLSGGIGIYPEKHPLYQSAHSTADLEDKAKHMDGKNAVSLFTVQENHCYHWEDFTVRILNDKLRLLRDFFDTEEQERGKAFLYRLLHFLRQSEDKINIARYAYLLARMEPKEKSKKDSYRKFSQAMYDCILSRRDRQDLITAIYIYTYLERKKTVKGVTDHE